MIFLDAYALIALLADEPPAAEVERLLRAERCAMTAVNLAESVDVALRVGGVPRAEVETVVGGLTHSGVIAVVEVAEDGGWRAAAVRAAHYAPRRSELSLADCFLVAAAGVDDAVATADVPVATAARAEGIRVIALAASSGVRP